MWCVFPRLLRLQDFEKTRAGRSMQLKMLFKLEILQTEHPTPLRPLRRTRTSENASCIGARGNEEVAPIPAVGGVTIEPPGSSCRAGSEQLRWLVARRRWFKCAGSRHSRGQYEPLVSLPTGRLAPVPLILH
jgi:hypothetical protein